MPEEEATAVADIVQRYAGDPGMLIPMMQDVQVGHGYLPQAELKELAGRLGCVVAAHTHIIGPFHSGLHSHESGAPMDWDPEEGIKKGGYDRPTKIHGSYPWRPNTIPCLEMDIPEGW